MQSNILRVFRFYKFVNPRSCLGWHWRLQMWNVQNMHWIAFEWIKRCKVEQIRVRLGFVSLSLSPWPYWHSARPDNLLSTYSSFFTAFVVFIFLYEQWNIQSTWDWESEREKGRERQKTKSGRKKMKKREEWIPFGNPGIFAKRSRPGEGVERTRNSASERKKERERRECKQVRPPSLVTIWLAHIRDTRPQTGSIGTQCNLHTTPSLI